MTNEKTNTGRTPSRGIALLLGLFCPWGTGQFYLGQAKRAVLWLTVPVLAFTLWFFALPWLGGLLGYGWVMGLVFVAFPAVWIGMLVDLWLIPKDRLRHVGSLRVLAYAGIAWAGGTAVACVLAFSLRFFVIEAFKIPSGAMQPALMVGDHIMADKLVLRSRKPKRGEAIIFKFPEHPNQDFVKRVLAISGDTLVVKNGHPWLNGWEVPHCLVGKGSMPDSEGGTFSGEVDVEFLDGEAYLTFFDERGAASDTQGPYTVADNEVWVLGDNRNNSHDSRFWFGGRGGGVPLAMVKARALFRWLSVTDAGVDWSRFGTGIADALLPVSMKSLEGGLKKCLEQRPPREKTVPPRTASADNANGQALPRDNPLRENAAGPRTTHWIPRGD
jgi:signal peptidase I